jgi:hypothetical protein
MLLYQLQYLVILYAIMTIFSHDTHENGAIFFINNFSFPTNPIHLYNIIFFIIPFISTCINMFHASGLFILNDNSNIFLFYCITSHSFPYFNNLLCTLYGMRNELIHTHTYYF